MFKPHRIEPRSQAADAEAAEVFETTDFYLACYLRCDGFRLAGIRRAGTRSVFQFEDRTDRESVTLSFFNNEGSVRPLAYSAAIKDLKALIVNGGAKLGHGAVQKGAACSASAWCAE